MNKFIVYILFNSLLVFGITNNAQANNIDSLKNELSIAKDDTTKANLLNEISAFYKRTDVEQSKQYALEGLVLARKTNHKREIIKALQLIGLSLASKGDQNKAIEHFLEGLSLAKAIDNTLLIGKTSNSLANSYLEAGNFQRALKHYQEALEATKSLNHLLGISMITSNIGILYMNMGDLDKGLAYFEEGANIGKQSNDALMIGNAYRNMARVYLERQQYDTSIILQKKSLTLAREVNDRYGVCYSLLDLSVAQNMKGLKEISNQNCLIALEEANKLGDNKVISDVYRVLSDINIENKNYKQALSFALEANEIIKKHDFGESNLDINKRLSSIYAELGDYKKAYKHNKQYNTLADSTFTEKNQRTTIEIETLYKTQEKEAENKSLRAENLRNKKIIKQRTTILIISSIAFILFILFTVAVYRGYRIKKESLIALEQKVKERTLALQQSNTSLLQTNAALERFNYIASHDLKEPLRSIAGFANLIKRRIEATGDESEKEHISYIVSASKRMYALIDAIREVTELRQRKIKLEPIVSTNIIKIAENNLSDTIKKHNGIINYSALPKINVDKKLFIIVFRHLIENGIIYNNNDIPIIDISYTTSNEYFTFRVKDNGMGVEKKYTQTIFEAFKRLHHYEQYSGTGIGLFITEYIIEMHGGSIWFEEGEKEQGSTFVFTVPK